MQYYIKLKLNAQKPKTALYCLKIYNNIINDTDLLLKSGITFYYFSIYFYKIFWIFYDIDRKNRDPLEIPELHFEYYKILPLYKKAPELLVYISSLYKQQKQYQMIAQRNLNKLIKRFYKKRGSPYLKVKARFPSINIAFRFKISEYVIF